MAGGAAGGNHLGCCTVHKVVADDSDVLGVTSVPTSTYWPSQIPVVALKRRATFRVPADSC